MPIQRILVILRELIKTWLRRIDHDPTVTWKGHDAFESEAIILMSIVGHRILGFSRVPCRAIVPVPEHLVTMPRDVTIACGVVEEIGHPCNQDPVDNCCKFHLGTNVIPRGRTAE